MTTSTITTAEDVYAFVAQLKTEAEKHLDTGFAAELDDALHLGSSGMEILGAIRKALIENRAKVKLLLGADGLNKTEQIITFVNRAFGQ